MNKLDALLVSMRENKHLSKRWEKGPMLWFGFVSCDSGGLSCNSKWWRICLQCSRPRFDPWVGKILWRREWQSTPVFLPGESHGQDPGKLHLWNHRELDTTEQLTTIAMWFWGRSRKEALLWIGFYHKSKVILWFDFIIPLISKVRKWKPNAGVDKEAAPTPISHDRRIFGYCYGLETLVPVQT